MSYPRPVLLCRDIETLNLKQVNADEYGDAHLHASVQIGPYLFHCLAYEVRVVDDILEATHPEFVSAITDVTNILDGCPARQTINGKTYVIAIVPYAE